MALLLKSHPPDVLASLREQESVAATAVATEERTIARLSAQLDSRMEFSTGPAAEASPPALISRGQRLIAVRLRDEATKRLEDAEVELATIRQDAVAARAARDARVKVESDPKLRAAVLDLRAGIRELMRKNQVVITLEDARARALEIRSPSETGSSLALPGWRAEKGSEDRLEMWERLQSIKMFLGE